MDFSNLIAERMLEVKASAVREIFKVASQPGVITLAGGNPAPESFPAEEIKEAAINILTEQPTVALQYNLSEGYPKLREQLKERMTNKFGINMENNELIVVSGSQQSADLVTKALINEGDGVICEEPSFIGCLNTFRTYKAKLYGVKLNNDGMDLEQLEKTLKENKNIKMIYTIPTFQNPSGVTTSLAVRKRMLELAVKYNVIILEDNPYGELRYSGEDVPTIKSMDTTGHVIYAGSFSKVFSPGLRLAYMVFDKGIMEKIVVGKQATDVHTNVFSQMIASYYLEHYDLDAQIEKIRQLYKHRGEWMLECMDKYFPTKNVSWTRPEGGIFLWVTLPDEIDTQKLLAESIEKKVAFVPGVAFMTDINKPTSCLRLNYSTMPDDKIEQGIKILGELLKSKLG